MHDINKNTTAGQLFVVATPIGNLEDLSLRAIQTLKTVDLIAAEDTRHSKKLLTRYQIHTPLVAYHAFNEMEKTPNLIKQLQHGQSIALISDAGTPLINDPGFLLIQQAHLAKLTVIPIPGPCAAVAALSVAGLPSDRFCFEGFLPAKAQARDQRLKKLSQEEQTLIFYEAPHRIINSLEAFVNIFGEERKACLARELTKIHETVYTATLKEILCWLQANPDQQRGEFVILVAGVHGEPSATEISLSLEHILQTLLKEIPLKEAVKITVELTGAKKNFIYELALKYLHRD